MATSSSSTAAGIASQAGQSSSPNRPPPCMVTAQATASTGNPTRSTSALTATMERLISWRLAGWPSPRAGQRHCAPKSSSRRPMNAPSRMSASLAWSSMVSSLTWPPLACKKEAPFRTPPRDSPPCGDVSRSSGRLRLDGLGGLLSVARLLGFSGLVGFHLVIALAIALALALARRNRRGAGIDDVAVDHGVHVAKGAIGQREAEGVAGDGGGDGEPAGLSRAGLEAILPVHRVRGQLFAEGQRHVDGATGGDLAHGE